MAKPTKAESVKEIERAEKALEAAKRNHRAAFRKAILSTFEEYCLALEATGTEGACIRIIPYTAGDRVELPE